MLPPSKEVGTTTSINPQKRHTPLPWRVQLEIDTNSALLGLGMIRNPVTRALHTQDLISYLTNALTGLAEIRRQAIADAIEQPGSSVTLVANALGLSRSAVSKLATSELRNHSIQGLRRRLENPDAPTGPATWTKTLSTWTEMNTVGLGNGRVLYLIASVARADNGWSWAIHNYKRDSQQLATGFEPTEREARIVAINELRRYDEYGTTNGPAERCHFAHMGENACGAPIETPAGSRLDTTTCPDCLGAMGLLG